MLSLPLSRRAFGQVSLQASIGLACGPALTASPVEGAAPKDARLGKPKTLNDNFPFVPPKSKAEWAARRAALREQVLVANGLWPMPEKTPLNAVVHGKIAREGYTVEKVYFASTPGHFVSGNLYRPTAGGAEKKPAVLFAHGHWAGGRLHDDGEVAARAAVARGEESDIERGRFFLQALPATLARLGFVVFQYDMVGYAESTAIAHIARSAVAHPEGFADVAGELRLQSLTGLQTWNSVRAADFLCALPDVDPVRLAVTGASGGGTQTFLLAAIDDRVAAAFPAVMVSTGMQGGCVCENASYLRIGTGNVELAGLFAPKPMAMSGANDWTKEIMTKGLPELRQLYKLHGAEGGVAAKAWVQFPHNYGQPSREFMYTWFRKHLMGNAEAVKEAPFVPVPVAELKVYDADHPRGPGELAARPLRQAMAKASDAALAALPAAERRKVLATALRVMTQTSVPGPGAVTVEGFESSESAGLIRHAATIGRRGEGDAVPSFGLTPAGFDGKAAVLWLHPAGKASLTAQGVPTPEVKALLAKGYAVLAVDVLGTGDLTYAKPPAVDKNYSGFTFGYNRALVADRVHDVLTALGNLLHNGKVPTVHLVGWGEFGPVAVLAKAVAGDSVARLAADLHRFRFDAITSMDDPMMLPGAVKYGGLPAFLELCTPGELLLHNHRGTGTGEARKADPKVTREPEQLTPAAVVAWLTR